MVKLLFLLILILLIAGGGYLIYTQKTTPSIVSITNNQPVKPMVTIAESDDAADLTALERDLMELDNLEADLETNSSAI